MERIRALVADAGRYFAQLTKRERLLLLLAAASVAIFVGSVVVGTVHSAIVHHEDAITDKEAQLRKVAVYAASYAESERNRRALESRLTGQPLMLMTHLQQLADKEGITISAMNDHGDQMHGQVKESDVELQIAGAPIDKVANLINAVERGPNIVKVRNLRLLRLRGDDKSLNVSMTVASYSLVRS